MISAQWWQTKAGMCSPDAQDSKKCWVGYATGTLWGSAGPNAKISEPLSLGNFWVKICHFGAKWPNPGFGGGKVHKAFKWVETGKKQELGICILIGWKKVCVADF